MTNNRQKAILFGPPLPENRAIDQKVDEHFTVRKQKDLIKNYYGQTMFGVQFRPNDP